jgi:hypothetical protein
MGQAQSALCSMSMTPPDKFDGVKCYSEDRICDGEKVES